MTETKKLWMPPIMSRELDKIKNRVLKKDRDWFLVIDGYEGVGKSVLAQQFAKYLDEEFNLDKIVFTSKQFDEVIRNPSLKKGSCVVLDESFGAANSRGALSEVNKAMVSLATEMRQKNLFIIMVLPSFFDLDKYFALWRCSALVHVYFTEEEDRNYVVFPRDAKKLLYLNGKKTYNYSKPRSPFPPFTFPNVYTVDEIEYRKKKRESFERKTGMTSRDHNWKEQRDCFIQFLIDRTRLTQKQIGEIPKEYGCEVMPPETIRNIKFSMLERSKPPETPRLWVYRDKVPAKKARNIKNPLDDDVVPKNEDVVPKFVVPKNDDVVPKNEDVVPK